MRREKNDEPSCAFAEYNPGVLHNKTFINELMNAYTQQPIKEFRLFINVVNQSVVMDLEECDYGPGGFGTPAIIKVDAIPGNVSGMKGEKFIIEIPKAFQRYLAKRILLNPATLTWEYVNDH